MLFFARINLTTPLIQSEFEYFAIQRKSEKTIVRIKDFKNIYFA